MSPTVVQGGAQTNIDFLAICLYHLKLHLPLRLRHPKHYYLYFKNILKHKQISMLYSLTLSELMLFIFNS